MIRTTCTPDFVRAAADIYAAQGVATATVEALVAAVSTFQPVETVCPDPPAALAWIDAAVAAPGAHPLTAMIGAFAPELPWLPAFRSPESDFFGDYTFCEIVGPEAPCQSGVIRFGLYLQTPETDYPMHHHAAIEHYCVLSGEADWQRGENAYLSQPPGQHIKHDSFEWHAMKTFAEPLLAMWLWTGDIDIATYRMLPGKPGP